MPFLDPEELKPKLREVFENVVVPQIIKAKIMDTELTAVNSLIETLLPFIDRSRVSDTMLHAITEIHIAMEKEQIIDAYDAGLYDTTFCEKVHAEQYYNETFKSVKHNTDIRSMDKLIESNKKFDENNLKGFKYDPNDRSEDTPNITNFFY